MQAHLQDVALLDGGVLQTTGFLLQSQRRLADGQVGDDFFRDAQGGLEFLHDLYLLLEALHVSQQPLGRGKKESTPSLQKDAPHPNHVLDADLKVIP